MEHIEFCDELTMIHFFLNLPILRGNVQSRAAVSEIPGNTDTSRQSNRGAASPSCVLFERLEPRVLLLRQRRVRLAGRRPAGHGPDADLGDPGSRRAGKLYKARSRLAVLGCIEAKFCK